MSVYIVISDGEYSHQASLAKRHYSGRFYEVVARGHYRDLIDLAKKLNEEGV